MLDRLSRSHRAMRSSRAGVDRDKLGFRSCRSFGLREHSSMDSRSVKLVRWTCERVDSGTRLRLWPDEIRGSALYSFSEYPWSETVGKSIFDSFCQRVPSVRYFEIEGKS